MRDPRGMRGSQGAPRRCHRGAGPRWGKGHSPDVGVGGLGTSTWGKPECDVESRERRGGRRLRPCGGEGRRPGAGQPGKPGWEEPVRSWGDGGHGRFGWRTVAMFSCVGPTSDPPRGFSMWKDAGERYPRLGADVQRCRPHARVSATTKTATVLKPPLSRTQRGGLLRAAGLQGVTMPAWASLPPLRPVPKPAPPPHLSGLMEAPLTRPRTCPSSGRRSPLLPQPHPTSELWVRIPLRPYIYCGWRPA